MIFLSSIWHFLQAFGNTLWSGRSTIAQDNQQMNQNLYGCYRRFSTEVKLWAAVTYSLAF